MKNLQRIFLLILTIFSFFISTGFANEKIEAEYFWGDGCSHCEALAPWLEKFEKEHEDKIIVHHHEIWRHPDEARLFNQLMTIYGVPEKERGTPSLILNNQVLIGGKDIKEGLQKSLETVNVTQPNESKADVLLGSMPNSQPPVIDDKKAKEHIDQSMTLKAIALTALADSINPCAIMVLVILLSSLLVYQKENKRKIILTASAFIVAVYLTYFILGLGLASIFATANVSKTIVIVVGIIAILVGLANLKDAFFYRKGDWAIEIPEKWRTKLAKIILAVTSPYGAFTAGIIVTMFELPCTGGPYIFGLSLISTSPTFIERLLLLAFYNLIFISPLIVIAFLVIQGKMTVEKAEKLKNDNVRFMHFLTGLIMISVGVWAIFFK